MLRALQFALLLFYLSSVLPGGHGHSPHSGTGDLICRRCGTLITKASAVREYRMVPQPKKSEKLLNTYNMTVVGVDTTINVLKNPAGYYFHVMAVDGADLHFQGDYVVSDTWYPGYRWRTCTCKECSQHAGWYFEEIGKPDSPKNFVGVVLDSVISSDAAEDLLKLPVW